jgi:hypothetical protein
MYKECGISTEGEKAIGMKGGGDDGREQESWLMRRFGVLMVMLPPSTAERLSDVTFAPELVSERCSVTTDRDGGEGSKREQRRAGAGGWTLKRTS